MKATSRPLATATEDPFHQYRVDLLVVLVGGNPLPNAVAIPLLTRLHARVVLLCSGETQKIADRIEESLDPNLAINVEIMQVDVSSRFAIENAIGIVVENATGDVGLHYTGGTKAMSVHAFRAVEYFARETKTRTVFSYLDARQLSMLVDVCTDGELPAHATVIPVGLTRFPLQKMLDLHEWTIQPGVVPETDKFLPFTTRAVAKINNSKDFREWIKWKTGLVNSSKTSTDLRNRPVTVWNPATIPLPGARALSKVRSALERELGITDGLLDLDTACTKLSVSREFLGEYFEAKWLEVLAMNALLDLQNEFELDDLHLSLKPALKSDPAVHFELDCVAVRGYQLFAVSCTVDPDREARAHLFEAYIRARQLGGDEARLALVCTTADPTTLVRKIRRDLDTGAKIRVFGRNDLPFLVKRFRIWIEDASPFSGTEDEYDMVNDAIADDNEEGDAEA